MFGILNYIIIHSIVDIVIDIILDCMFICSKSSVLLGLSLTVPLMVACLSVGIPIWIQNGYKFWISGGTDAGLTGNQAFTRRKEVWRFPYLFIFGSIY